MVFCCSIHSEGEHISTLCPRWVSHKE